MTVQDSSSDAIKKLFQMQSRTETAIRQMAEVTLTSSEQMEAMRGIVRTMGGELNAEMYPFRTCTLPEGKGIASAVMDARAVIAALEETLLSEPAHSADYLWRLREARNERVAARQGRKEAAMEE